MYTDSKLWKRIMLNNGDHDEDKENLRAAFATARKNAEKLAGEIKCHLPEFTEHGISHLDALWKMTDIFLPKDYPFNPAEIFVLGVSFLIHDLGMGLAAYSEGMEGIQKETIWRDTVAALCKQKNIDYDFDSIETIDKDIRREATEVTLRTLHAEKAEQLGVMSWKIQGSHGEEQFHIIESDDLRDGYGEIIGRIAASHGWNIERVASEFDGQEGAISSFPTDWTVDSFKLACIIRIADAINIDDSRATKILRAIRKPGQYSMLHWIFQEKLSQAQLIDHRIAFSSKSAFTVNERDAWWLCYDTLKWIDVEIRKVDSALLQSGRNPFRCIGVHSIDNISDLQKRIKVKGWQPVDTQIRVTKVAHLVKTLGGMALYGDNELVPLRELIQNASDAIRARRCLKRKKAVYDGTITITLGAQNGERYLEVEDNGVGMSTNTLINTLLDFGNSFWKTDGMHSEFPGLEQTDFHSTGHFGIGFFSVFMWGEHVVVTTKRYDAGDKETRVLEFVAGIEERPYLRVAKEDEQIGDGGTRVRVYFSGDVVLEKQGVSLESIIETLCPTMDCNIDIVKNEIRERIICENDWMTIDTRELLKRCGKTDHKFIKERLGEYEFLCNCIRPIVENGKTVGRIGVSMFYRWWLNDGIIPSGIITVGGLYSCRMRYISGVLLGKEDSTNASRNFGIPKVSSMALDTWAIEQATLINNSVLSNVLKLRFSNILCGLANVPSFIKIAMFRNELLSLDELEEEIRNRGDVKYYIIDYDYSQSYYAGDALIINEEKYYSAIICDGDNKCYEYSFPRKYVEIPFDFNSGIIDKRRLHIGSAVDKIIETIAKCWNIDKNLIYKSVKGHYEKDVLNKHCLYPIYEINKPVGCS